MKLLPLTSGGHALVDDADYEALARYRWRQRRDGYVVRSDRSIPSRQRRLHQDLAGPGEGYVDHIDRNKLNNQRGNLRRVTVRQNATNRSPQGASRFKGVTRHKRAGKWQTAITVDGAFRYLGLRETEEEAARLYDAAAREAFGDFAYLNFPAL